MWGAMMSPNPRRNVGFLLQTQGGVQHVRLFRNEVLGQFTNKLTQIGGMSESPLVRFMNCPRDPDSIAQFTEKAGPLMKEAKPGAEFRFDVQEFKDAQDRLREMWQNFRQYTGSATDLMKELGGSILLHKGSVIYNAPTLYKYLYADLLSTPAEQLRICRREECTQPYFIADHLNRQFCSTECAQQYRSEENKAWWQMEGKSWRRKRAKSK
jgi:hypothetical protein